MSPKPESKIYRGECADGLRCLHGCHVNEACFFAPKERFEKRIFDFAAGEDGGWMAWGACSEAEYLHYDGRRADVEVRKAAS